MDSRREREKEHVGREDQRGEERKGEDKSREGRKAKIRGGVRKERPGSYNLLLKEILKIEVHKDRHL
jgi:hypothetical protein